MYKKYRNVLLHNSSKYCLIGKINGLSLEAKKARKKFLKNTKKNGYCVWRKLVIGKDIRHHLLAYAFMRGLPYSAVEPKCREDNSPKVKDILNITLAHICSYEHYQWTEDRVIKWLRGEKV